MLCGLDMNRTLRKMSQDRRRSLSPYGTILPERGQSPIILSQPNTASRSMHVLALLLLGGWQGDTSLSRVPDELGAMAVYDMGVPRSGETD